METEISKLKVAVLTGGISTERQISLQSGDCVAQALKEAGLNVVVADISPDNLDVLEDDSIDVFFIAMHGRFGEDGQLQQILEDRSLLYTGSGPVASGLAFDKLASKECFAKAGITIPKAIKFDDQTEPEELERQLRQLGKRYVVKPVRQGSTIGVSIVDDPKSAVARARQCSSKFGDCMIEEYICGREVTVGILEDRALPIIEIRTRSGFYDYHAKYLDEQTEFLFDTIEDSTTRANINTAAVGCFEALGLKDFARIDLMLGDDEVPYALEANTVPGLTTHSLVPKAAAKAGLSMSQLCMRIIEMALAGKTIPVAQHIGRSEQ